jgi:hypothetical protein
MRLCLLHRELGGLELVHLLQASVCFMLAVEAAAEVQQDLDKALLEAVTVARLLLLVRLPLQTQEVAVVAQVMMPLLTAAMEALAS